jgi:hypothetical protein
VLVEGNIPALTWKKDALGKNKPTAVSQEAKNDYLLEVLKVQTDRLKWVQGESTQTPPAGSAPKPQENDYKGKKEINEPLGKDKEPLDLPF